MEEVVCPELNTYGDIVLIRDISVKALLSEVQHKIYGFSYLHLSSVFNFTPKLTNIKNLFSRLLWFFLFFFYLHMVEGMVKKEVP